MPVIPANKVVDKKRIIGQNGGPRRRRGTRGGRPKRFRVLVVAPCNEAVSTEIN
jgi:hypothetical protein